MNYLYALTALALIISFVKDKNKTVTGLNIAWKRLRNISGPFLFVFVLVSLVLYFIPGPLISKYLTAGNKFVNILVAAILGSITMLPGFIAFPLSGILRQNGVPFMVISAFTTTLMMVGIVTFPIEKEFSGFKVALLRNVISLFIGLAVAVATGIFFGEIF